MERTFRHKQGCAFNHSTAPSTPQNPARTMFPHSRSLSDDQESLQIMNGYYYPIYDFDFGTPSSLSDATSIDQCVQEDLGYQQFDWSRQALYNGIPMSESMHPSNLSVQPLQGQTKFPDGSPPCQSEMPGSSSDSCLRPQFQGDTLACFRWLGLQSRHKEVPTSVPRWQQEHRSIFGYGNHLPGRSLFEANLQTPPLDAANLSGYNGSCEPYSSFDIPKQPPSDVCTSWPDNGNSSQEQNQISGYNSSSPCPQTPPPPPESSEDSALVPYQQRLRSQDDLYTPKWVRGTGTNREGWCDLCRPGRWLVLKNSAYWYDKTFSHGVSHHTGRRFADPVMIRPGSRSKGRRRALTTGDLGQHRQVDGSAPQKASSPEKDRNVRQGLCGTCGQWIALGAGRKCKGYGLNWYRHAYKCQTRSRSFDGNQTFINQRPTSLPLNIINWSPNSGGSGEPNEHSS